ncbi:MAG: YHS domain-containing protein [Candidatus Bathyarchaeia archaeon]
MFLPLIIISRKHTSTRSLLCEVKGEIMPRDPVCGAILDDKTSKFKITYEGETYHFCSLTCKKRFKRNPMKFVK